MPTVIGQKSGNIPTQVKDLGGQVKPTAIPAFPASSILPPRVPPVRIGSASSIPGVKVESPQEVRERIVALYPGVNEDVIERILVLTREYSFKSKDSFTPCYLKIMERYKKTVDRFLVVTNSDITDKTTRHLSRLLDILSEIKESIDNTSFWKKRDVWDVYNTSIVEIQQLISLLSEDGKSIHSTINNLEGMVAEYSDIRLSVVAFITILRQSDHKDVLLPVEMNSQELAVTIEQGSITRNMIIQGLNNLLDKIDNTVLIKIPTWMECVALMRVTKTETDKSQFKDSLNDILSKLLR